MDVRDPNPTRGLPLVAPKNMLPVQVVGREVDVPGVVSVFIVLPGTRQAPAPYLPGQFVTLALPTPRETLYRSYSLCGDGDSDEPWELTIKQMEQGAVSSYFYESVHPGTLLYSSLPRGTFTLPAAVEPEMVFVFVAAGSGITPIMGMLRALARMPAERRPLVLLHYASRTPDDIIFRDEIWNMDSEQEWLSQYHYLSSRHQRMTADAILERSGRFAAKAHWYMCGPDQLKKDLQERLATYRVPSSRIHAEIFATAPAPAYRVAQGVGAGGSLRVADTRAELDVQPQETLLTALERHGYRPNFSCRVGACGECRLRVLAGQVDNPGELLSDAEQADGYVLGCIARPLGAVTIATGGRPPAGVARVAASGSVGSGSGRGRAVTATRLISLVGASALALGAWGLTNHRPASWPAPTVAVPTTQTAPPHGDKTPAPHAGTGTGSGAGAQPTAVTQPTQPPGGGGAPAATATPAPAATPTPRPKPTPAATSTPSTHP